MCARDPDQPSQYPSVHTRTQNTPIPPTNHHATQHARTCSSISTRARCRARLWQSVFKASPTVRAAAAWMKRWPGGERLGGGCLGGARSGREGSESGGRRLGFLGGGGEGGCCWHRHRPEGFCSRRHTIYVFAYIAPPSPSLASFIAPEADGHPDGRHVLGQGHPQGQVGLPQQQVIVLLFIGLVWLGGGCNVYGVVVSFGWGLVYGGAVMGG